MTYSIGSDLGSSSVKVALVENETGKKIAVTHEPRGEMEIKAPQLNWAVQDPEMWWTHVCNATQKVIQHAQINSKLITGIGISYQMHGLVVVDKDGNPLRDAIIWCDSRAVEIGNQAFNAIGKQHCVDSLLNSPGNFTASKLKWVKDNEPDIYEKIYKFMLPGDYIAYKLTGEILTTRNGLAEGILWDYAQNTVAYQVLSHYGIDTSLVPNLVENFSNQGSSHAQATSETGLPIGIPVVYRAGDQPNNALSLNVLKPGEVAATAGTSGVLYALTNQLNTNEPERINHFAHVNYDDQNKTVGKLLCVNGSGILYRWLKNNSLANEYDEMNIQAEQIPVGAQGHVVLPFGNGAERMFYNKNIGAHFLNFNFNVHNYTHQFRAALEGIAFSFVYGMELLKNDNFDVQVIRAGNDNLFRSLIFSNTISTLIGHEIEIYNTTGAIGAARAVAAMDKDFDMFSKRIATHDHVMTYTPINDKQVYLDAYQKWVDSLNKFL